MEATLYNESPSAGATAGRASGPFCSLFQAASRASRAVRDRVDVDEPRRAFACFHERDTDGGMYVLSPSALGKRTTTSAATGASAKGAKELIEKVGLSTSCGSSSSKGRTEVEPSAKSTLCICESIRIESRLLRRCTILIVRLSFLWVFQSLFTGKLEREMASCCMSLYTYIISLLNLREFILSTLVRIRVGMPFPSELNGLNGYSFEQIPAAILTEK